jgi:hypothetical protein
MKTRGEYRKRSKLNIIRMSLTVLPEERKDIEVLSQMLGISMSGSIALAVKEMKERLELEAKDIE